MGMTVIGSRRRVLQWLAAGAAGSALGGCGGSDDETMLAPVRGRTWRLGMSPFPPRPTPEAAVQGIDLWSRRAEVAIIHEDLPWADLLAGMTPDAILDRDKATLVQYLRGKGLALFFMLDVTNGLDRAAEATALRAAGRSLTEPGVQTLARAYALAVARRLAPEYLGLAAETNLVRLLAPAPLYQAVRQNANDIHAALTAAGATARRFVSVQVETAWGRLGGNGAFTGIDQDLVDFPFTEALGLSSYPYFGFSTPEAIPDDYYSRLRGARTLPLMVVEGGWTSASVGSVSSSPDLQARYIDRHAALLDSVAAVACCQLQFADLDLATFPQPQPANLPLFASLGLTDSQFAPKPALARWDALHARPRV